MQKKERQAKACETKRDPRVPVHKGDGINYLTCPGNFFQGAALQWLELHGKYDQGILPFPGAIMDQPNKMIEVFRVIQAHKDKIREERTREAEMHSRLNDAR